MIKTFEQFNEVDPYGEENWDDNYANLLKVHKIIKDFCDEGIVENCDEILEEEGVYGFSFDIRCTYRTLKIDINDVETWDIRNMLTEIIIFLISGDIRIGSDIEDSYIIEKIDRESILKYLKIIQDGDGGYGVERILKPGEAEHLMGQIDSFAKNINN